jgi:hypothetical protein
MVATLVPCAFPRLPPSCREGCRQPSQGVARGGSRGTRTSRAGGMLRARQRRAQAQRDRRLRAKMRKLYGVMTDTPLGPEDVAAAPAGRDAGTSRGKDDAREEVGRSDPVAQPRIGRRTGRLQAPVQAASDGSRLAHGPARSRQPQRALPRHRLQPSLNAESATAALHGRGRAPRLPAPSSSSARSPCEVAAR